METVLVEALVDIIGPKIFQRKAGMGKAGLCFMGLTAFMAGAAVICLLIAFDAWMEQSFTPAIAALMTAALSLVVAGASWGGWVLISRKAKRMRQQSDHALRGISNDLTSLITLAADELEAPIVNNPRMSVLLAGVAGYVAGQKLH